MNILRAVAKLEKVYAKYQSGVLTIVGITPDNLMTVGEPYPGRQMSPGEVAAWRGMVFFLSEAAADLMADQAPKMHNVEIILRDDGSISIQKFNGWKGKLF